MRSQNNTKITKYRCGLWFSLKLLKSRDILILYRVNVIFNHSTYLNFKLERHPYSYFLNDVYMILNDLLFVYVYLFQRKNLIRVLLKILRSDITRNFKLFVFFCCLRFSVLYWLLFIPDIPCWYIYLFILTSWKTFMTFSRSKERVVSEKH